MGTGLLVSFGINALVHALKALPSIEGDVRAALAESWGTDHVQDALQGARLLGKIVEDLASAHAFPLPETVAVAPTAVPVIEKATPAEPVSPDATELVTAQGATVTPVASVPDPDPLDIPPKPVAPPPSTVAPKPVI